MKYYKKIVGEHIYLSPISLEDSNKYLDWIISDNKQNQAVFEGYKKNIPNLAAAKKELQSMTANDSFAIIDSDTNELIGYCGFSDIVSLNQRAELWIKINPSMDKQKQIDLGAEALNKLIYYAQDYLNLNSLIIKIPAFNSTLLDVVKNSKMRFLGIRTTSSKFLDGKYYDTLYFQISRVSSKDEISVPSFSLEGKDLDLFEKDTRSVITGERVTLIKYRRNKRQDNLLTEFLNVYDNALPLGEFKRNFTPEFSRSFLEDTEYLILVDDKFIGYIKTIAKDKFNRSAGLEILIGDSMYKGKGLGSESLDLFLNEVFSKKRYSNIMSSVFDFNRSSIALHEKLGFTYVGTREQAYYSNGFFNDMHYYEMTEEQYKNRKK